MLEGAEIVLLLCMIVEGSRSRTGKLLPAKLGVLKYVLEALESGKIEDCWLCPISLQYDKVIETESYVNELLGNPKEKERSVILTKFSSLSMCEKLTLLDRF
jgi:glycerol-3-phosphate O-acyltransferase